MNLLFFGGPLLVFCCFAVGRTSTINFSDGTTVGEEDENHEMEAEREGEELNGEDERDNLNIAVV